MADVFFDNPPVLAGKTEDQLRQLYNHLFRMSDQLNQALMNISIEQMSPETKVVVQAGVQAEAQNTQDKETLKSLIIKTAEIVRSEMDEIRTTLQSRYEAISEQFGTYQQTIDTQIAATAAGILQDYHIEERIQGVETDTQEFINGINAYIYSGILDANNTVGIAIGYNVTNEDGTLNQANKMATFTAEKLSFWLNDVEAAWFSNSVFHIKRGEVEEEMRMGRYIWKTFTSGAMGLMKA